MLARTCGFELSHTGDAWVAVTAFEAYLDMYSLTGDARYHDAMVGAWEMFRESFIHVGGSMAINEGSDGLDTSKGLWYPPKR